MFFSLLKKEVMQFCRFKSNIFLLFIFPILLITTLSIGLKNMMNNSISLFEDEENSKVFYSVEEGSKYEYAFNNFIEGSKEAIDIKYEEMPLDSIKEKVDNYEALMHINVGKDGFNIYTSKQGEKINSQVFRGIFESVLNEYAAYNTIAEYNSSAFANLIESKYDDYVTKENNGKLKGVSSSEYYTFAELALIILYVATIVGESVYSENQLTTINRIRLSKVRESEIIKAKVMLGVIISTIQTLLVYVYSSKILDVSWGDNTLKFIILFIVLGLFVSVLGAVVGLLSKKDTTVGSVLNIFIVTMCALGGSYAPINMIITIPVLNKFVYLSPIYWINTATSSIICGLESQAYMISIIILITLSIICIAFYFSVLRRKGGILND